MRQFIGTLLDVHPETGSLFGFCKGAGLRGCNTWRLALPDKEPDYRLMRRVAIGEEEAIAELYDRFGALVFKLSIQFLSNNAEAEDAVQEVFVRLWKTADRFDPRKAKLVTWVMLITRRHLIDCIRRIGRWLY